MWDTRIITYHHALQPTFITAHSNDTNSLAALSSFSLTQLIWKETCTNCQQFRTLQPNEEWEFSFSVNFFDTTRFYGSFRYKNFNAAFDVSSPKFKDYICDGDICIWMLQEDEFYLIEKDVDKVEMYDWEQ